ncbi:sodium/calcium exchanger NCL-like [Primulina huaijiensis]|uniref:sodium/calcium exchanger NCL-like n=1 Tax=Primulina huaijiensis TaxID=1492673 RepID=UPI003CC79AF8
MRRHNKPRPFLTGLLFLILCGLACGRLISDGSDITSDGVNSTKVPRFIRLYAAAETCEQTYGFMPCTSTALGNLFLILVYGYLMFLAATYLSSGSELLLEILGPGLIGGLFLPILGALPDALLILVSGLSGSTETAQSQVSVGMGLLAGSTVMLLTLIWGACVVFGKCDIENSVAVDSKDTKGFSLTGSGISTDIWTSYAGIVMALSVVPFVIVQFPRIFHSNSGKHLAVLIGLIVSISLLISYCLYQVFQPSVQRRRLAYAKHKHVISGILQHLKMHSLGKLCTEDGRPDEEILEKLFKSIDDNDDGILQRSEVKALILGIRFNDINLDEEDAVEKVMNDFNVTNDSAIDYTEFKSGVERWLEVARGGGSVNHSSSMKYIDNFHQLTRREYDLLGDLSDEVVEGVDNARSTTVKAVLLLLLGTAIAAVFADPLVDAVDNFSSATSIPTFFISFIALPFATNSSEAVSAIIFSSRKKFRSASLSFSELYGAVTMNNVLCLSVFLAIVYVRGLEWDFSSEVLVILIVCLVMGFFASIRTTFPLWTSILAFLLYPFSLALVYVLDYVFGWT